MSTIHNPSNFDPQDYEIVDYIDNQGPQTPNPMYLLSLSDESRDRVIQDWKRAKNQWIEECKSYFGDSWGNTIHTCSHCGHSYHLRYIAVVKHIPTGDIIPFGHICAERLSFEDKASFRLAFIQNQAKRDRDLEVRIENRKMFNEQNPEFIELLESFSKINSYNSFLRDIMNKFHNTFELPSPRQMEVFSQKAKEAIEKHEQKTAEEAGEVKVPVPFTEERIKVEGTVISFREQETAFGIVTKVLLKCEGYKLWGNAPTATSDYGRNDRLSFYARIQKSDRDEYFGFFKRPTKVQVLSKS